MAIYVVRRFWQALIVLKSRQKQIKTPESRDFRCFYGGDYWTRTSDLLRVNGLGKLFLAISDPIQHRRLHIQNDLTILYHSVSAHSAPHCGYLCGQNRFPSDIGNPMGSGFLVCRLPLYGEVSNSFYDIHIPAQITTP